MEKNTLWFIFVLLIVYFTVVFCEETVNQDENLNTEESSALQTASTNLIDEARTRRRHGFYHHLWGWHALAIAYWIKVKLVIVAFFVGSAVFVGLRYLWPNKCSSDWSHEGPIIYENPHSFAHSDHIPYSIDHSEHSDHSFEAGSFEPYSAYENAYSDITPSTAPDPSDIHRGRRSLNRQIQTEEQIADFMFYFLGLDSQACRRRFICEMEFRAKENPITSMAFRVVGKGFFNKYTNALNRNGLAKSFQDCALVNPQCVFIERDSNENPNTESENVTEPLSENSDLNNDNDQEEQVNNEFDNNYDLDQETQNNEILKSERRHNNVNRRGSRSLDIVAEHILTKPKLP
ncbi:uncharacterized protein LOC119677806 [Teleopsis dalmanni]|uniref:uncharacterized protein LOC119677806 n=1 Tax=Teleopsis dalmanni TaxID=139649 RepID=UPI0018CE2567|nr:uncharacterized protein LOC119677806 [Teleopsis dalmanni]